MLRLLTPNHVNGIGLRSESLRDENDHIDYKREFSFLFASHANYLVHCSHFYGRRVPLSTGQTPQLANPIGLSS
jgi:hypothetical protein